MNVQPDIFVDVAAVIYFIICKFEFPQFSEKLKILPLVYLEFDHWNHVSRFVFWILGYCSMSDKCQQLYKLHFSEKKISNSPDCWLWHKLNLRSRFSWVLRVADNIYWAFAVSQNFASCFMKICSFDSHKSSGYGIAPPHFMNSTHGRTEIQEPRFYGL